MRWRTLSAKCQRQTLFWRFLKFEDYFHNTGNIGQIIIMPRQTWIKLTNLHYITLHCGQPYSLISSPFFFLTCTLTDVKPQLFSGLNFQPYSAPSTLSRHSSSSLATTPKQGEDKAGSSVASGGSSDRSNPRDRSQSVGCVLIQLHYLILNIVQRYLAVLASTVLDESGFGESFSHICLRD